MAITTFILESVGAAKVTLSLLLLASAVIGYSWSQQAIIYNSFPRVADGRLRSFFWPQHVQDLVWNGYQNVCSAHVRSISTDRI
jgi:hypothetical protein